MGVSHKSLMKSNKNISNSKGKFLMKSNIDDSGNVSETEINNEDVNIPTNNAGCVETEEITSASSDSEEEYEKAPRLKKEAAVRNLLPIKGKDGLIFRSEILKDEDDKEEDAPLVSEDQKKGEKSLIHKYIAQRKNFEALKRKIALLCTSVIEDPENHMNALKELITMLLNPTTKMIISEKRILCVSLLHVFTDILPGYQIRIPEEKETKIKLKKDTRKLLSYEKNLLRHYKKYLDHLHDLTLGIKRKRKETKVSAVRRKALREICLIAVKCMCELLYTRFSFNYFKNIANKLVPLAVSKDKEISDMCCKSFEKMFKADKLGEASLELIKQIVNVIKERKFYVPGALLRTFLRLNLREAKPVIEKIDMKKGRAQWCKMSRTERRNKKKIKGLEAELKEAQAYECVENVKKFHTETLKKIFWVYFHVLKDGEKVSLIAPALEGLSNFAYLINLEFFDDLNSVICRLMESGTLSNVEKLHGVHTLFTILAGQAESLHIDPHRIYCHMYQSLLHLNHLSEVEHFSLILKCLEFNILRKKKKNFIQPYFGICKTYFNNLFADSCSWYFGASKCFAEHNIEYFGC